MASYTTKLDVKQSLPNHECLMPPIHTTATEYENCCTFVSGVRNHGVPVFEWYQTRVVLGSEILVLHIPFKILKLPKISCGSGGIGRLHQVETQEMLLRGMATTGYVFGLRPGLACSRITSRNLHAWTRFRRKLFVEELLTRTRSTKG